MKILSKTYDKMCDWWHGLGKRKREWLTWVVIPTLLPVFMMMGMDIYYEYTLRQIVERHILDLFLVIFSVLIGLSNTALEERIVNDDYSSYGLFLVFSVFVGSVYCFLYAVDHSQNKFLVVAFSLTILLGFFTMKAGSTLYGNIDADSERKNNST